MKITKSEIIKMATNCPDCEHIMINPGYHKNTVNCCGKLRTWYKTWEHTFWVDDGRNEKGQFFKKPCSESISFKEVID